MKHAVCLSKLVSPDLLGDLFLSILIEKKHPQIKLQHFPKSMNMDIWGRCYIKLNLYMRFLN